MSKQKRADLLLVTVTAFWGTSYYLSDLCMKEMGPMTLNAYRFLSAFILLSIVLWKHVRHMNLTTLKYSVLVGLALTGTYIFYGYGLPRTSISNAGFICALPVVVTPLFDFLFCHHRLKRSFAVALIVCLVGIALLTLNSDLKLASGDIICLGVPVCYAIDLLIMERAVHSEGVDPLAIGVLQLGVVGVITLVFAFILETPALPATPVTWAATLFLGIFCSGIAFVMQATQQQYTSASHVGLIFTLEPIFSAIVAYFFAGERMSVRGIVGAGLMVISLLMIEIDFPFAKRKGA